MTHPELPHNLEAERAALGAAMVSADAMSRAAVWLTPAMFYLERHALIWRAMLDLLRQHDPVSIKTVLFALQKADALDQVGGIEYLADLGDGAYSGHIDAYAAEIERTALLRRLIDAGGTIAATGYGEPDAEQAIGTAQKLLADIALRRPGSGLLSSSEAADREYARLELANNGQLPSTGVRTGFRDLDETLLGLNAGDLVIVAARPSVGKTAFLLSLAHGVAREHDDRDVLIFSLEMSEEQLRYRRIAMLSRLDTMRIRSLRLSEADQSAYMQSLGELAAMPIYVDDTAAVPVTYLRSAAYRHQARAGRPLVIFVDYIQLMSCAGEKIENRVQAVSEISRGLKALAKELDAPVIALSQLSRAVESRPSKVPLLSDLRESGGLEQDADVVLFIYREELYDKDTDKKGIAELHIAKHRNGPIGVIPMRFDAATTRFDTLSYRTPEGY